jgi:hypothetical protein
MNSCHCIFYFVLMCDLAFYFVIWNRSRFKSDLNSNGFANYKKVSKIKGVFLFSFRLWAEALPNPT